MDHVPIHRYSTTTSSLASLSTRYERRRQMWLVCGRAMLTLAILGLVTVLMYYVAERVHEVETTVVPLSVNDSSRYEIHNRTVVRGSRSRRSARKFDPFFGMFPVVGASELPMVAPSIVAWDRPIGKVKRQQQQEDRVEENGDDGVVRPALDNEVDDLSAEKIELPKSRVENRKRRVRSVPPSPPPTSLLITGDEDRGELNAGVVIDSAGKPASLLSVKTSLGADDDEMRLPQNALRSRMPLSGEVGNVPKIDRNLFDTSEEQEEVDASEVVDQKTVTADHDDDLLEPQSGEDANAEKERLRRRTQIYSREDVSYVFVPDCITKPQTRLQPPRTYQLPGGFKHQGGGGQRRPHTQDYRDQRNRHRPQDYGRYSM